MQCNPNRCSQKLGHIGLCDDMKRCTHTRTRKKYVNSSTLKKQRKTYLKKTFNVGKKRKGNQPLNKPMQRQQPKEYNSIPKAMHRDTFSLFCKQFIHKDGNILYLETGQGLATKSLIENGFPQERLYPCNICTSELQELAKKYPSVNCTNKDIREAAQFDTWLGIWWDMEETWTTYKNCEEWNYDKVPVQFDNAYVVAVSLSSRGQQCEQHAIDLSELLYDENHNLSTTNGCLKFQPYAYEGESGHQNMIFGVAIYERQLQKNSKHFNISKLPIRNPEKKSTYSSPVQCKRSAICTKFNGVELPYSNNIICVCFIA